MLHSLSINCSATAAGGEVHVPYYNSKLTHMLKDSLGGNSRSTMICTMGSESSMYHHSLYSLMFAARAFKVVNLVHINRLIIDPSLFEAKDDAAILRELKDKLLASSSATPINHKFAKMNGSNAEINCATPRREMLNLVRTEKPDMSTLMKMAEREKAAKAERRVQKAASSEEKADDPSESADAPPVPLLSPPPALKSKLYTLWMDGIVGQDLKYVTFPLCPAVIIKVGQRELRTQRYRTLSAIQR